MSDSTLSTSVPDSLAPARDERRATIGILLEQDYIDRLAHATTGAARLRTLTKLDVADECDLLVVDPRLLISGATDSTVLRRHVGADVPCVYYTDASPHSLRAALTLADVSAVRLLLFGVDDDASTLRSVVALAPRHAHALTLQRALEAVLAPLLPSARAALQTVVRLPERFFDASDLARVSGLSRRHLDRVLTRAQLAPAKNWVVGARAWHALHLLSRARCSAEATAARLGYADSKGLRRHLAAVWDASPTEVVSACGDELLRQLVSFLTSPGDGLDAADV